MQYYDQLMLEYYRVLNNAWKQKLKESAYMAIRLLSEMPRDERMNRRQVEQLVDNIGVKLGTEFAAAMTEPTKAYIERSIRLGTQDVRSDARVRISIGLWGLEDQKMSDTLQQQNLFWLGKHYGQDISDDFKSTLTQAIDQGFTKEMLADALRDKFSDLGEKSQAYWQGLAEHTALRIREFARLKGYQKAKVQYYRLVNPMDQRTSDICRALVGANKIYPLSVAVEVVDNLMALDMDRMGMDAARDEIKALAPWVKDSQIVYDGEGNPTGVQGAHTPFPPFHWKCRTQTEIVE